MTTHNPDGRSTSNYLAGHPSNYNDNPLRTESVRVYPVDARTFGQMDDDDFAQEEAIREIALGLPGRPGVIR